jgi:hypothetical protein
MEPQCEFDFGDVVRKVTGTVELHKAFIQVLHRVIPPVRLRVSRHEGGV